MPRVGAIDVFLYHTNHILQTSDLLNDRNDLGFPRVVADFIITRSLRLELAAGGELRVPDVVKDWCSRHHHHVHRSMRMCEEDVVRDDGNGDGIDDDDSHVCEATCACTGDSKNNVRLHWCDQPSSCFFSSSRLSVPEPCC